MEQLVDLKVGFSCNNNCIHCVVSDKFREKDLTLCEIKKIINSYIEQYREIKLTLTGGEVTIRNDFVELMSFIKEKKDDGKILFVDLQTNGRMLSCDNLLNAAIGVVDFYLVALHGDVQKIHDSITRSNGSFVQTICAIDKIFNFVGPEKIAIQTVINRKNYRRLKKIYSFAYENIGIQEFNMTFPHPIGICYSQKVVPTYKEVQPYVNEALAYCLKKGIKPYIEALPLCIFRSNNNRKYALDFISHKCTNVVGYAGEKDGKINYKELFSSGHLKYKTCSNCRYNYTCDGVWKEYLWLYPNENMINLMK